MADNSIVNDKNATIHTWNPADEFFIRDILPLREVHLVAGASGAGKTTWLIKMIERWKDGNKVFGHESYPKPFVYMSGDRSEAGVRRTFKRVGVEPAGFNIYAPRGIERRLSLVSLLTKAAKNNPTAKVFFVEGMGSKVPGGKTNDYTVVANFLMELQDLCERLDITIVGVVHSSKSKEGESYLDPRQQVLGSVAWASYSETIIIMEQLRGGKNGDGSLRKLSLLPRNSKEEVYKLEFVGGELVPVKAKETNWLVFERFLSALAIGELFTNKEAMDATELSDSSLRLELTRAVNQKLISRDKVGHYAKLPQGDDYAAPAEEIGDPAVNDSIRNVEAFFHDDQK